MAIFQPWLWEATQTMLDTTTQNKQVQEIAVSEIK